MTDTTPRTGHIILAVLEPHIAVFVIVSRKQMEMCANILVTLSVKYGTM